MRYDVELVKRADDGFRYFNVYPVRPVSGRGPFTQVWVSHVNGSIKCTNCSGPLTAMLSSCKHANAVRRHLKKTTP